MSPTDIATMRALHASWDGLSTEDQMRAYALHTVDGDTILAAYEEAREKAGSASPMRNADAYYRAHHFHHWLKRFTGQQAYFRTIGVMPKLRAKLDREAQVLRDAGLRDPEIADVQRRAA